MKMNLKNRSHRHYINRPTSRREHEYSKYKYKKCLILTMLIEKPWSGNLMYKTRNLSVMLKLMSRERDRAQDENGNIVHAQYFVLNDYFENILIPWGIIWKQKTILKKSLNQ